jgi:3-hydroxy-3-methylglutaryl CoA synthase
MANRNIGILRYGAYLPRYLLKRSQIADAWEFPSIPGGIAVANHDEDTITMAVEAGLDCLEAFDPLKVDGLFFATTTPPYTEKLSAALIASVLDFRSDILTMDITDSTRAFSTALARAYEAIKAGSAKTILVIGADTQIAQPESMYEYQYGDGAAALLVSSENPVVAIEGFVSTSDNVIGPYKRQSDTYIRQFEPKHEQVFGFSRNMAAALKMLLEKQKIEPKAVKKIALYSSDPRSGNALGEKIGFSPQNIENSPFLEIGNTGNAFAAMMLITSLRRGKAGDYAVFGGYGDGADAFLLKIIDKSALTDLRRSCRGYTTHANSMVTLKNYPAFLAKKKKLEKERFTRKSSPVREWREEKFLLRMYGMKCKKCGVVQYPIWRACIECGAKDEKEDVKLQRTGKIFTFTLDHLVGGDYYDTPVPRCVIDLDGGGRILLDMTDVDDPNQVRIGMPVELTFRWAHPGANTHNYYWKCRQPRSSAGGKEEEGA